MSQSHKDVLQALTPIKLGENFDADLDIEGDHLDEIQEDAQVLLEEMFPNTTDGLISDWEGLLGLPDPCVGQPESTEQRIAALTAKWAEKRNLSKAYLIDLASRLGYTVTIDNYSMRRFGSAFCGGEYIGKEWGNTITLNADGEEINSLGIEPLLCAIQRLRPAHVFVGTSYFRIISSINLLSGYSVYDIFVDADDYIHVAYYGGGIAAYRFVGSTLVLVASRPSPQYVKSISGDGTYIYTVSNAGVVAYTFDGTAYTQVASTFTATVSNGVCAGGGYVFVMQSGTGGRLYALSFDGSSFTEIDYVDHSSTGYGKMYWDGEILHSLHGTSGIYANRFDGSLLSIAGYYRDGSEFSWVSGFGSQILTANNTRGAKVLSFGGSSYSVIAALPSYEISGRAVAAFGGKIAVSGPSEVYVYELDINGFSLICTIGIDLIGPYPTILATYQTAYLITACGSTTAGGKLSILTFG